MNSKSPGDHSKRFFFIHKHNFPMMTIGLISCVKIMNTKICRETCSKLEEDYENKGTLALLYDTGINQIYSRF